MCFGFSTDKQMNFQVAHTGKTPNNPKKTTHKQSNPENNPHPSFSFPLSNIIPYSISKGMESEATQMNVHQSSGCPYTIITIFHLGNTKIFMLKVKSE